MTTYVHVNRGTIDSNRKHGTDKPAIRFQTGKYGKPSYAQEVEIDGPCRFVASMHEPILPCGARVVIVTDANVRAVK